MVQKPWDDFLSREVRTLTYGSNNRLTARFQTSQEIPTCLVSLMRERMRESGEAIDAELIKATAGVVYLGTSICSYTLQLSESTFNKAVVIQ
jgi:hypothetical protein